MIKKLHKYRRILCSCLALIIVFSLFTVNVSAESRVEPSDLTLFDLNNTTYVSRLYNDGSVNIQQFNLGPDFTGCRLSSISDEPFATTWCNRTASDFFWDTYNHSDGSIDFHVKSSYILRWMNTFSSDGGAYPEFTDLGQRGLLNPNNKTHYTVKSGSKYTVQFKYRLLNRHTHPNFIGCKLRVDFFTVDCWECLVDGYCDEHNEKSVGSTFYREVSLTREAFSVEYDLDNLSRDFTTVYADFTNDLGRDVTIVGFRFIVTPEFSDGAGASCDKEGDWIYRLDSLGFGVSEYLHTNALVDVNENFGNSNGELTEAQDNLLDSLYDTSSDVFDLYNPLDFTLSAEVIAAMSGVSFLFNDLVDVLDLNLILSVSISLGAFALLVGIGINVFNSVQKSGSKSKKSAKSKKGGS